MEGQHNWFVEALSAENRRLLLSAAKRVHLPQGAVLHESAEPNEYVYFLLSGLSSQVVTVLDGGTAEVGMIGSEGIVGGAALLGPLPPVTRCSMQTDGMALRVPVEEMRKLFVSSPELRVCVLECVQQQALTLHQIAACNTLHRASERLSRWLLTAADRTGSDRVILTQESLAAMLGTRRTTVALMAGSLQRSGLIEYRRGKITIIDREGLQASACDCYAVITRLIENLYGRAQFTLGYQAAGSSTANAMRR